MKLFEEWSTEALEHELERYKTRRAFCQQESAERLEWIDEAISMLTNEIDSRNHQGKTHVRLEEQER